MSLIRAAVHAQTTAKASQETSLNVRKTVDKILNYFLTLEIVEDGEVLSDEEEGGGGGLFIIIQYLAREQSHRGKYHWYS